MNEEKKNHDDLLDKKYKNCYSAKPSSEREFNSIFIYFNDLTSVLMF